MNWQEIARKRREEIVIPDEWKIKVDPSIINDKSTLNVENYPEKYLGESELSITNSPTLLLQKKLASGVLSAESVIKAFLWRTAIAHQLTNCLTVFLYQEALNQAKQLDKIFQETGKPVGPFHGLPFSVKEVFELKGYDCTWGLISEVGKKYESDGQIVQIYKRLGAVIIAKTNVSQGLMGVESDNNVFGKVLNPRNLSLTAAGSSGGESALVAMRGCVMGIGNDAGGSVRLPAASTGVYGFYPTPGRVSTKGISGFGKHGLAWVRFAFGPLTNDMDAVELYARTMIGPEYPDVTCFPVPWREPVAKKYKIGFLIQDQIIEWTPPMKRVMKEVQSAIDNDGKWSTEAVDSGSLHRRIVETVFAMYVAEGVTSLRESVEKTGEPFINRICGSEYGPTSSLHEVYALDRDAARQCDEYIEWLNSHDLDAIITPACANPPAPHGKYSSNCLSAVYNLLGYTMGVIPVGRVDPAKDEPPAEYTNSPAFPDLDVPYYVYDKYDSYVKKELYTSTDKFKNAPLAIQIACPKFQDEKLVEIMKYIDQLVNGNK